MGTRNGRPLVLIAGAGVAAIEAALALDDVARDAVEVCLVAPAREFVYRPMAVAEPFGFGTASRIPVADLLEHCRSADHIVDGIAEVRPDERIVVTASSQKLRYDALLIATGARADVVLPGALTFAGPQSVTAYRQLLASLDAGDVQRLVFALPPVCLWGLPLYELALMTAEHLFERRIAGVELTFVTHERSPLEAFGGRGSEIVAYLMSRYGIELELGASTADLEADAVVSVPRITGRPIIGLPHDPDEFLPVDEHLRVREVDRVWAAGDTTDHPIKQGGLAAQQADAAAESIAAWAGVPIHPKPFVPVLRGMLLTGEVPAYLRADSDIHGRRRFAAREKPLWWPAAKVAGRYLAPVLAAHGIGTGRNLRADEART